MAINSCWNIAPAAHGVHLAGRSEFTKILRSQSSIGIERNFKDTQFFGPSRENSSKQTVRPGFQRRDPRSQEREAEGDQ
jgi:hypothetical protein